VVEALYISYFGRPADPQGLTNFEAQLLNDGAPTGIQDLASAYSTSSVIKTLIDGFSTSAESVALYGSGNANAFVTAVYQNVLGRAPQSAGLAFWVNAINSGSLTQSDAALAIMAGGQTNTTPQGLLDAALISNRITVASEFTFTDASTPGNVYAYAGATAAAAARSMLATVNSSTDAVAFQTTVNTTISNLVALAFSVVQGIITQRCVACHSAHPVESVVSQSGFSTAPAGVELDTPAEIQQYGSFIYECAALSQAACDGLVMPYANITGMLPSERSTIGAWYLAGANQ
jgi:hypothetical protein